MDSTSLIAPPSPLPNLCLLTITPPLKPKRHRYPEAEPTPTSTPKPKPKPKATSTPTPTPTPSPTTTETPKPLPPGAYHGRVIWPQGLGLRTEPQQDAQRVGGAAFNQKIIILEESNDKAWQKIRVEGTNQEGWVKAGNTERSEKQDEPQQQ